MKKEIEINENLYIGTTDIKLKDLANDLYYKPGDTYEMANATIPFGGFITGGRTNLQLATIFLPKSLKNINTITLNRVEVICRQNGNYILGTASNWFSDVSKITVNKMSENSVRLYYTAPSEITNATNNDAVGVAVANLKLKFS